MTHWADDAIFYHIYPLGLTGAPQRIDFSSVPVSRLDPLEAWDDHMTRLGCNALYLGPLFESSSHGYDTADYYTVDRRLGDDAALARLSTRLHERGIRLVLDGVFNHTGRDFWAYRDIREKGPASPYCGWYANLRFGESNAFGDPFRCDTWAGHDNLPRLNLQHPDVRAHLLGAARMWIEKFDIDGLRLDAADCVDFGFLQELAAICRGLKPDFWLMGEVVHGDYRRWANPQTLDSVTNYECYKGLYSSLNDQNYFEIDYALKRQFGEDGLYRGLTLYNFVDNHDVDRVAGLLRDPGLLFPLYLLLFTMPGVPSVYYGSEFGLADKKTAHSDAPLRPALDLNRLPDSDLTRAIARLSRLRLALPALRRGDYRPVHVGSNQLAFLRQSAEQTVLVILNATPETVELDLAAAGLGDGFWQDALNPGEQVAVRSGKLKAKLYPHWGRVLVR